MSNICPNKYINNFKQSILCILHIMKFYNCKGEGGGVCPDIGRYMREEGAQFGLKCQRW